MKKSYSFILAVAIAALITQNLKAQSPISGGYTISALLTDSGNVYWTGRVGGGCCPISTGNVFVKVLRGAQPDLPSPNSSPFLKNIVLMNSNAGNHVLTKDCDYVYAFGGGGDGQLGDGNTNTTDVPVRVRTGEQGSASGFLEDVIWVSTGNLSSYAVLSDGRVMAWGNNASGRLGDGTTTQRNTPVFVKTALNTPLTDVIQVSGLENAAVALKSDGTVWGWGAAGSGEIGGPNTSYARQIMGYPNPIVKINTGDFNTLALDDQGYLWNLGRGNTNALGNGTNANTTVPTRVLAVGATYPSTEYLSGVVDMDAGQEFGMALLSNGKVAIWGNNSGGVQGQGGGGANMTPVYVRNPTNTGDLDGIAYIGAGDDHALAMKLDGTLYTWGSNAQGKLGLGHTTSRNLPTEVTPRPYKIKTLCPSAYLGPDVTLCNPLSTDLYAGSQGSTFKYEWYKDGVLLTDSALNYATEAYFTVNEPGTYKVVISDTAAFYVCTPCPPSEDEVIITTNTVAPINGTFCAPGTATLQVDDSGNTYDWYATATGGSVLSGGSGTNTYTTPSLSSTTTYYVQDTRTYTYNNASSYLYPPTQSGLSQVDQCVSSTHLPTRMVFTVEQTLTLVSVDVVKVGTGNCSGGIVSPQLRLDKLTTPGGAVESFQTVNITLNCSSGAELNTVPLNLTLEPGYYRLQWNSSFCSSRNYTGAVYPTGVPGLISFNNPSISSAINTSSFFNWTITAPLNCGRIPVQAIERTDCSILPVHLLSFSGNKVKNTSHLSWSTAMEENSAGFEIQRGIYENDFVTIGIVEAAGNSSSVLNYSYIDADIKHSSVYYYRLKQVDLDGTSEYSPVISVDHSGSQGSVISIYPNPVSRGEQLHVTVTSEEKEALQIRIYDLSGKLISETNEFTESGITNITVDTKDIAKGLYVLNILSGTGVHPFKFMVE